jgi:hypothetical protein
VVWAKRTEGRRGVRAKYPRGGAWWARARAREVEWASCVGIGWGDGVDSADGVGGGFGRLPTPVSSRTLLARTAPCRCSFAEWWLGAAWR